MAVAVKTKQNKLWSESRAGHIIQFKVSLSDHRHFTFDAWNVETKGHVGVHSPHPHRPCYHLQVTKPGIEHASYCDLGHSKTLRYYAQIFERTVKKEFGVNAWKVFS